MLLSLHPSFALPPDPAIPLLGIYPEKTIIQKGTYVFKFKF